MNHPDVCLTLILSKHREDDVLEEFLRSPDVVGGFTVTYVEGYSVSSGFRDAKEHVRGHGTRVQVQILADRQAAAEILSRLQSDPRNRGIVYWLQPVLEFGALS